MMQHHHWTLPHSEVIQQINIYAVININHNGNIVLSTVAEWNND